MASARGSSVFDVLTSCFLCDILQVQHNRAKSPEQPSSWDLGALSTRGCSWDLGQKATNAVSLAFTTPETKLGWLTRTAVTVAGVYVVGWYGKAPALRIVQCTKEAVEAAGTTLHAQFAETKLSIAGSSDPTQRGLHC